MRLIWTAVLLAALGACVPSMGAVIDTYTSPWSGGFVSPFGEGNTATYGQTFTALVGDTSLDSFSFWLQKGPSGDAVDFGAYIMAWSGDRATGAVLWDSTASLGPSILPSPSDLTEFSYSTGGLQLVAGQQYVAFLCASNYFDGAWGTASMPISWDERYTGGVAVWYNNGGDFSLLTSHRWDNPGYTGDMAFRAEFSPPTNVTPELSTWALLACTGLAGVGMLRRRRKA